ncbi:MAG TPA: DUF1349 domain-containing protein [Crinalium sp.]
MPPTSPIMRWYNEPSSWQDQDGVLTVTSGSNTDFWRKTHYGFIRDSGNFYYCEVAGDFVAEVKVSGNYETLYDQAGLMIRADSRIWMKCGIEYVGDRQNMSTVITRDYSDWSVMPLSENPDALWLRVKRSGGAIEVFFSLDGEDYPLFRVAYLSEATVQVGPMVAAPDGNGVSVTFENFQVLR